MKINNLLLCGVVFIFFVTACSKDPVAYIDKSRKAIVSGNGSAFKRVMVNGAGKQVVFDSFSADRQNSIIYFNRVNPGFVVAEGFGLNKNYILRLEPGKKYTVYIYTNPKDDAAVPVYFRTDYNSNIVLEGDEDK
ncbi:hypothetical protein [Mucilaginibacter sp.]|jgi:hypothetical protein|uniref:hypothetical protein n=1 Tax=Mucilaginibacter sp. TaxID=1882438 RepID=UPI002BDEDD11|nr:hypothetical protein [Mucilaginibacter sp.]HTI58513.1 hypothetical protein [Mucilaginibacter sp.]